MMTVFAHEVEAIKMRLKPPWIVGTLGLKLDRKREARCQVWPSWSPRHFRAHSFLGLPV